MTKIIVSAAAGLLAILVLDGGAMAATTVVNIADPTVPARVAHVDAGNRLAVQEVPPTTFFHGGYAIAIIGSFAVRAAVNKNRGSLA